MITDQEIVKSQVEKMMSTAWIPGNYLMIIKKTYEAYKMSTKLTQGDLLSFVLFSLPLEKAIRVRQMETTGVAIG